MQERAIIQAIKNNELDDLDDLLILVENKELKVDETDKHGRTALILAAEKGYTQVINALLAHGADINATDDNGKNALMCAAINGDMDTIDLLIEFGGVDMDASDTFGNTALTLATNENRLEVVDKLLTYGAKSCFDDLPEITFKASHQDDFPLPRPPLKHSRDAPIPTETMIKAEQLMKDRTNTQRELRSFFCAAYQYSHSFFSKSTECELSEEKKAMSSPRMFSLSMRPLNYPVLIPEPKTVPQLQQLQILLPELVKIIEEYLSFNTFSQSRKQLN